MLMLGQCPVTALVIRVMVAKLEAGRLDRPAAFSEWTQIIFSICYHHNFYWSQQPVIL